MTVSKTLCGALGATGLSLFAAMPAWAQEAATAAAAAPVPNKGDTRGCWSRPSWSC
jgi:Amt family ammonium transporter